MDSTATTAINQANYIMRYTDKPEGMVRVWAEQARLGLITVAMRRELEARYIELGGQVHLQAPGSWTGRALR